MSDSDRFIPPECRGLRDGVEAPDLSSLILCEVDKRRGWVSRRQRMLLCVARWGAASVALGVLAGVLLVERYTPAKEAIAPEQRVLADLMQNVRDETSVAVQNVSTQMRTLPQQLMSQSRQFVAARMERIDGKRVVELAGPAVVVDEATLSLGHLEPAPAASGLVSDARMVIVRGPNARAYPGVGLIWPVSLSAPSASHELPLIQAAGLERDK